MQKKRVGAGKLSVDEFRSMQKRVCVEELRKVLKMLFMCKTIDVSVQEFRKVQKNCVDCRLIEVNVVEILKKVQKN